MTETTKPQPGSTGSDITVRKPRPIIERLTKPWILLLVALATPLFLIVPGDSDRDPLLLGLQAVFAVLLVIGLGVLALSLAGRDPLAEDRARDAFGEDLACVALLGRWLRRSRHFRFVGGLGGLILAVGTWDNGIDLQSTAVGVLAGVAAGGALAEVHGWRRRGNPRVAELTQRRVADYARPIDLAALGTVSASALGLGLWGSSGGDRATNLPAASAALAIAVVTVAAMQLLVSRPRPALDPLLRQADELMRRLAATQGFVRPAIAVCFILVAIALETSGAHGITIAAVWVAGLVWYWRSTQSGRNLRSVIR